MKNLYVLGMSEKIRIKWSLLSSQQREAISRLILLLPYCVILIGVGLNFRLIGDEGSFTLKVVEKFSVEWPFPDIINYRSSTPPLPYLIFTAFGKIFGFEIWKLRLLTVFLTIIAINLFYDLCKRYKLPTPLLAALYLLFFPYIFFHGFTVYTMSFGLLFGVLALRYYLSDEASKRNLLAASVAATLAIYSRQEYLALPVAILIYEFFRIPRGKLFSTIKIRFWNWFLLATPLMLILPLFILWRGVSPPDPYVQKLAIVPQHLNFAPIFVGFYFLPFLFSKNFLELLNSKKIILITFIVLIPVFIIFPLTYSDEMNELAVAMGIIIHGIDLVGKYLGEVMIIIVRIVLWVVGILLILSEVRSNAWDSVKLKLFSILGTFLVLITFTPYVAERYYMLAFAPLVLIFHKSQRDKWISFLWLAFLILLSIAFTYWQIHLK